MSTNKPTDGLISLCNKLGAPYTIRVIDKENVIYRDLGNGFDFEISNVDYNRDKIRASVYVWNAKKGYIAESIVDIKSYAELCDVLNKAAEKYSRLDPGVEV